MYFKPSLLIFSILFLLFFSYLHSTPVFSDPDSFYHARITSLMIEKGGLVTEFPWLPYTALADTFTDHHLLYHVALIPFISLFGPVWGIKIASTVAATFVWIVFWLLAWWLVPTPPSRKKAFLISLVAATLVFNTTFFLRMNLEKMPAVSLLWLFAGFAAITQKKPRLVFFLSFFHVWLHSSWALLPIFAFLARNRTLFFASCLGSVAGLVINPYFPTNISFYLIQIYHIAIVTYHELLPVGSEWLPRGPSLISFNLFSMLLFCAASILFFFRPLFPAKSAPQARTRNEWLLFFISLFFLMLTLKSARHGEYFTPFASLFSALVLVPYLVDTSRQRLEDIAIKYLSGGFFRLFGVLTLVSLFFLVLLNSAKDVVHAFRAGQLIETYQGAALFLQNHTKKNEIVFHDSWDTFYPLWYYNQHNRYISGFDPTFLFIKNPELFWAYERIIQGAIQTNVSASIESLLGSRVILVEKENSALQSALEKDSRVKKMYEDSFVKIYRPLTR